MTTSENEDAKRTEDAEKRAQARAERLKWMNNPEAAHSLSDVAPEGRGFESNKDAAAFLLTEGDNVIASKTTARAEAEAKSAGGAVAQLNTDELLSQWSGQKQKQKARRSSVQEDLLQRVRTEIDSEIDQIREQGYPLGAELILIARAFGKDPKQWLPCDKVSNLFIEAVLYSAGLDLPWGFDSIPDYAELKYILSEDKRFIRVFRHDKMRVSESAAEFAGCAIEDGDIALWASPEVHRSGLIERAEGGNHNILSAGCEDSPTGFVYTTLEFFINTYAAKSPTPDIVYRLTRL